jgi:hypothetical protein
VELGHHRAVRRTEDGRDELMLEDGDLDVVYYRGSAGIELG